MDTREILKSVKENRLTIDEALEKLKDLPYENIGFARLDHHRELRTGFPEVIFCQGKTSEQTAEIFQKLYEKSGRVLATRASLEQYEAVHQRIQNAIFHEAARTITAVSVPVPHKGMVAICTGGTADIPVAEEAAVTAEMCGATVDKIYDIGVSGLHRLLDSLPEIRRANAVVAVAGMEGALASVLAGQLDKPVIAVPTSVGYGANFGGLSSLLTMINSCATGIAVVNIDNGFGGGYMAALINKLAAGGES